VVLERGEVANSLAPRAVDSLRLLTPNWQARLPGYQYDGGDPDGFMTMPEVVAFIARYAQVGCPGAQPYHRHVDRPTEDGYRVATTQGDWHCRTLVCERRVQCPSVPALGAAVPSVGDVRHGARVPQSTPASGGRRAGGGRVGDRRAARRRNPPVGRPSRSRSASTCDCRAPTAGGTCCGGWSAPGVWNQRYDGDRRHHTPRAGCHPPQLVGTPDRSTLDLNTLSASGVELVGRLAAVRDGKALFSGGCGICSRWRI
jgi:putative flavoprotein involved in K+ transport